MLQKETPLKECSHDQPITLTQRGLQLTMEVHHSRLKGGCQPECCMRSVARDKDGRSDDAFRFGVKETCFRGESTLNVTDEFIRVRCFCSTTPKATLYEDFRTFIVPKANNTDSQPKSDVKNKEKVGVYLVGLDSISTLNFKRYLPKVQQVLENELRAIPMTGLTKVGVNTFPNIVPLLTGLAVNQLNQSLRGSPFDHQPFIWKSFAALDYVTLYMEDEPLFSTFNYMKKGFFSQPTDHYGRHLYLAIHRSKLAKRSGNHCVNGRLTLDLQLQWLEDLIAQPDPSPQFALVFSNSPSHKGPLSHIRPLQPRLLQFLQTYRTSRRYNSSILILFSDHGMRFGPIMRTELGGYESRMPLFYIVPPPRFETDHPERLASLRTNSRRLTTFFDVHATLRDVLLDAGATSSDLPVFPGPGHSLFAPVPEERSCEDAGIAPQWCVCRVRQPLPPDLDVVSRVANATVRHINDVLLRQVRAQCAELRLLRVIDAYLTLSETGGKVKDTHYKLEAFDEISVRLVTEPGLAEFESTVRCFQGLGSSEQSHQRTAAVEGLDGRCRPHHRLSVMDVSRLNLYRGQSECLKEHFDERRFCYCKELL
ncbi:uncharacterized protein LOC122376635 [Amphibalanus amphitrite]|uniref:uncharacterized protein LOC122376635 n=1 Tax=Amphibalanus amphitrite TaxID=1232801 RepID=UPI001C8FF4E6|nr:uncharacterized protein LOC122376635 [Amphibalanus amphitrite]